jgi:soluble lytic murein transglycosylase-like protein
MPPAVLVLLLALATVTAQAGPGQKKKVSDWTDKFDVHFSKYAKHYFGPNLDWRWFKAQAIAESGLKPDAKSKSGAHGIMQILPSTYREIQEKNPDMKDLDSPRWNIAAGIYYDRTLYKRWDTPPPGDERLFFAFGSYNAGYARMRDTLQKLDPPAASWEQAEHHVPGQTRHYVRRIRKLMDKL